MFNNLNDIITFLVSTFLAVLGGIVRVLSAQDQTSEYRPSSYDYTKNVVISMFVGVLAYTVCREYGASDNMTAAFTGLAGYSGTHVLDYAMNRVKHLMDKFDVKK